MCALHVRGDLTDHRAERPDQRGRREFGDGHGDLPLAADGGDFGTGEACPDDQYPGGSGGQGSLQALGVLAGTDDEHPAQGRLALHEPGPGSHAGGDQDPVEGDVPPVGEAYVVGRQVEPAGGRAQQPLRVDVTTPRQLGAVGRYPPGQYLLGQWGSVVGLAHFVTDHGQRSGETLIAQALRGP